MKTTFVLEDVLELNTTAFAINSHVKDYNLCWHINKALGFELKKKQNINVPESFFLFEHDEQKIILLKNKTKKGHLLTEKKNIDFLIGNILGSNIFNIVIVMGIVGFINTSSVLIEQNDIFRDIFMILITTLMLIIITKNSVNF